MEAVVVVKFIQVYIWGKCGLRRYTAAHLALVSNSVLNQSCSLLVLVNRLVIKKDCTIKVTATVGAVINSAKFFSSLWSNFSWVRSSVSSQTEMDVTFSVALYTCSFHIIIPTCIQLVPFLCIPCIAGEVAIYIPPCCHALCIYQKASSISAWLLFQIVAFYLYFS